MLRNLFLSSLSSLSSNESSTQTKVYLDYEYANESPNESSTSFDIPALENHLVSPKASPITQSRQKKVP